MPELAHPERLLALLAVAAVAVVLVRAGHPRHAAVRSLLGTLLVLALADPAVRGPTAPLPVVHVVDTSASIPQTAQQAMWSDVKAAASPTSRVVQVDATARWVLPDTPGGPLPERLPPSETPDGTALAAGLQLAAQSLPTTGGRLVVHTDGWSDPTAVAQAVETLAGRGITVQAVPPELPTAPADLTALTLPPQAAVGSTLAGTLGAWGGAQGLSTTAKLVLEGPDGTQLPAPPVDVRAPAETLTNTAFTVELPPDLPPGMWKVHVGPEMPGGAPLVGGVQVVRPPQVLLVRGNSRDGAVLEGILEAEGLRITATSAPNAPALTAELDLVVLAGPPTSGPAALEASWLAGLADFVEAGGGLLTLAGPGAYASGGWQDSALAPILPVRIDPDGAEKDDSVALLVVLDKSGSMARPATDARSVEGMVSGVADMMVGGRAQGSKIQVASEAAAATMTRLRDHDRIGVLAVDTLPYWSVAFTDGRLRASAMKQVRRISAGGGGMYVLTALEAAAEAMRTEDAPLRHILMLIDASDAGEQTQDIYGDVRSAVGLAQELRAEGVTVSVVGIGSAQSRDSPFLRRLTQAGGGRLQLTPDIRQVSALFAQEVERLVGSAVTEQAPVRVRVSGWHEALVGVDMARAPQIHGWADVLPRPGARNVLTTPAGTPILAVWNRGLGAVASWTTDDGARWARRWPAWDANARLWTQLVRGVARDVVRSEGGFTLDPVAGGLELRLQVPDAQGRPQPIGTPVLKVLIDGLPLPAPPLSLAAPGVLVGHLAAEPGARVQVGGSIQAPDGSPLPLAPVQAIIPTSPERDHRGTNPAVLNLLQSTHAAPSPPPGPRTPLWPWLLVAAALLLPVDAWARRGARQPATR